MGLKDSRSGCTRSCWAGNPKRCRSCLRKYERICGIHESTFYMICESFLFFVFLEPHATFSPPFSIKSFFLPTPLGLRGHSARWRGSGSPNTHKGRFQVFRFSTAKCHYSLTLGTKTSWVTYGQKPFTASPATA